jgi:hypothetical protein
MLINVKSHELIQMLELWQYKTGMRPSEFIRVVDCEEGFKVGVVDYTDSEKELVSDWDNLTEEHAKKIRQGILEAVRA